jgi:hypothetical protein
MDLGHYTKTGLTIALLLAIIMMGSYIVDEIGVYFYETQKTQNKIFDIVHELAPDLHTYEDWVNLIPALLLLGFFIVPNGFSLAKEFVAKILFIWFLRALTLVTTVLPKHEKCRRRWTWKNCFKGQCYDKVFSGHTSFVFLASLLFYREGFLSWPALIGIVALEICIILLTRSHYTIDVVIALLITYIVNDGDYHMLGEFVQKIEAQLEKEIPQLAPVVSLTSEVA